MFHRTSFRSRGFALAAVLATPAWGALMFASLGGRISPTVSATVMSAPEAGVVSPADGADALTGDRPVEPIDGKGLSCCTGPGGGCGIYSGGCPSGSTASPCPCWPASVTAAGLHGENGRP